jgi:hypothetical protein
VKVIGLIGGMSWNSNLEYYRLINESASHRMGGLHSACLDYTAGLTSPLLLFVEYDRFVFYVKPP